MKKINPILILIIFFGINLVNAQNVIKEVEFDNIKVDGKTSYFFKFPFYMSLGEKGILIREGNKYQLYDLDLNKKWELQVPPHDIVFKDFGMVYYKMVSSNDFIYVIENYEEAYTAGVYGKQKHTHKTFLTQIDFNGKIIADKSFENIISESETIIDFFASDEGCHYVATDFYKNIPPNGDIKKDFFGTFVKNDLTHSVKEISLPYDPNEKIHLKHTISQTPVLYSCNFYYSDAELGKGYYGDNISSRLTRYYYDDDNSYFCQTILINKKGEISNSIIFDKIKSDKLGNKCWDGGKTFYCEEQKLFYSFWPIKKLDGTETLKVVVTGDDGKVVKTKDFSFDEITEIAKKISDIPKLDNPQNPEWYPFFENIFYDNFNDCLAFAWPGSLLLMDKSLEIIGGYKGGDGLDPYQFIRVFEFNGGFSLNSYLRPSENYICFYSSPGNQFAVKPFSKNSFDYFSKNGGTGKNENDSYKSTNSYKVLTIGEYQYAIIDNNLTKKSKIAKLEK